MSKYSGMTNENAAYQYACDLEKSEQREAHIERLVEQDMKDLREFGMTYTENTEKNTHLTNW